VTINEARCQVNRLRCQNRRLAGVTQGHQFALFITTEHPLLMRKLRCTTNVGYNETPNFWVTRIYLVLHCVPKN